MSKIEKERLWVFSPVTNVVFSADFIGDIEDKQLIDAIDQAVCHAKVLANKVCVDEKDAWFSPIQQACYHVAMDERLEEDIVREQEKIPFDIWNGEFLRFFYRKCNNGYHLILIAHHLIGDGISFSIFFEQILRALANERLEDILQEDIDIKAVTHNLKLNPMLRVMMKMMNLKWKKTGRIFTKEDYMRMNESYWKQHESYYHTLSISKDDYNHLINYSKQEKLTINSLIVTSLLEQETTLHDCGLAVSFREKENRCLGNYATGITVDYSYNPSLSFVENARKVQEQVQTTLQNEKKKYFLMTFMSKMEPTLIDAIYFAALNCFDNKTAKQFATMFGYMGNPKGINITNLTKVPIKDQIGDLQLKHLTFLPPLVLNAQRVIGIASLGNEMQMTIHLDHKKETKTFIMMFEQAIERLSHL